MKKLIFTQLFFLSTIAYAQTEKGHWFVGSNFSRNFVLPKISGTNGAWSSIIELPNIGYFVAKNLAVGVSTSIHIPPQNIQILFGDAVPYIYSLNPMVKLYFGKTKLRLYSQIQYRYGTQNVGQTFTTQGILLKEDSHNKVSVLQGSFGGTYFFNPKVSFDSAIYIDQTNSTLQGTFIDPNSNQPIKSEPVKNINIGVRFGLFFYF